jgi:hypothetical protein
MNVLEIFEPALCCATGVCGPEPDQQLIELQNTINLLVKAEVQVKRYAINQVPMAFVKNETVKAFVKANGPGKLPLTLLDGELILAGSYPTIEMLKDKIPVLKDVKPENRILGQFS